MSSTAPVAVATRGGDGDGKPVSHRTKHRKEVKRYHQRQQNKALREEAKARDAQLFLFERGADASGKEQAAAEAEAAAPTARAEAQRTATGTPTPAAAASAVKAITEKAGTPAGPSTSTELITTSAATASTLAAVTPLPPNAAASAAAPDVRRSPQSDSWGFNFVLRDASPHAGAAGGGAATVAASTAVAEAPLEAAALTGAVVAVAASPPHALLSPLPAVTQTSLVPATRAAPKPFPNQQQSGGQRRHHQPSGNSEPISVLPIDSVVSTSITKLLSNAHVQRVDGVPAIPMESPLPTGTDLNRPPRNYLTMDPQHNIHQHAPGFVRDQRVALQHMLATAVANWQDAQQNALIVTSAEALRTIFEQVYVPSRPLALRVRRIGPTILIDSSATQSSLVSELRQQALFSKALYLMTETHGRTYATTTASATEAPAAASAAAGEQLALALPARRLSSLDASDAARFGGGFHRYSQLLRWRIDSTELLVGNDAAVVLDERTGVEQLVRVKAADVAQSTDAEQQETLRFWFEAMLANVPYVGTYLECDGTVLSYQVKKTNDLLGYVEARMAGAALGFTSTALQWLVKHCQRDGGTYAMFRGVATDELKLYELPDVDDSNAFVQETDRYFSASSAAAGRHEGGGPAKFDDRTAGEGGSYGAYPSNTPRLSPFTLNLGRTCLRIGQCLHRDGGLPRANDALTLLRRSFDVFLPCCAADAEARETIVEVVHMLPALISRKIQADASRSAAAAAASSPAPQSSPSPASCGAAVVGAHSVPCTTGGGADGGRVGAVSCPQAEKTPAGFVTAACSSPELYREALLLCGGFEVPLRRAFVSASGAAEEKEGDALLPAFYARCLVASSAAVCTVVAASLDAYYCGCHHLRVMRRARAEGKAKDGGKTAALRGVDYREDVMNVLAAMIQDLLQVVVEGLVRLEETSALISPLHAAPSAPVAPAPQSSSAHGAAERWAVPATAGAAVAAAAATVTAGPPPAIEAGAALQAKDEQSSAGHSISSADSTMSVGSLTATTTTTNTVKRGNDVDNDRDSRRRTSSPARVAVAAVQRGEADAATATTTAAALCGTVIDPRTQVDATPLRSALCELYGDVVMVAMADSASGFTTRVLAELGARLEARAAAAGQRMPTTLMWLTALRPDVVSLSFTALRFYGRVPSHTRRHLHKLAQVYYLVGKEHYRTARYTKALEALHRSKSLLQAAHKAAEDVSFGDAFGTNGMMQWGDVMRLLGDVYRRVAERKLETAVGRARNTVAQPLLAGPLHDYPKDADSFFTQALSTYKQGGADEACRAARSCTLLIYASVLIERIALLGERASHAASREIVELLRESEAATPHRYVPEREWQLMRLFTVTNPSAADGALVRAVEDLMLRLASSPQSCAKPLPRVGDGDGDRVREPMWVDADVADCGGRRQEHLVVPPQCVMLEGLQRALVCAVMVERLAPPPRTAEGPGSPAASETKYRSLLCWVRRAAAYLASIMNYFLDSKEYWRTPAARHQWLSTLRTWGEHSLGGCVLRMVCMIALRVLVAAQAQLPAAKQQEAREAFRQVTRVLEGAPAAATADSEDAHEAVNSALGELLDVLRPFGEW